MIMRLIKINRTHFNFLLKLQDASAEMICCPAVKA